MPCPHDITERVVVFREPSAKESYQAMISSLPLGATVVAQYEGGKCLRSLKSE